MDYNPNRAGSLTLKSSLPMEYSRTVLSNKWYLKRENEPRDNELWSGPKPNLHQSTYKILGKQLENDERTRNSLETETRFKHEEALRLKAEEDVANELDTVKEMVDMQNKARLDINLNNYDNLKDSVLMHQEGYNKHHLETTYNKDFEHPNPEMIDYKDEKMLKREFENSVDNSWCYRRQVSQFSDIDAPKRTGVNTFHIQTGEYPNQVMKHKIHASQSNNIFELQHYNKIQ